MATFVGGSTSEANIDVPRAQSLIGMQSSCKKTDISANVVRVLD
jgi:hypothetical protein